jgi:small subunit ribosomal protein S16
VAVTIRLSRKGRHKRPFYRIVVADSRMPRDGRFIEILGTYNTLTDPATILVKTERALDWLNKGAQLSVTVKHIFQKTGVLPQRTKAKETP